ncbi:hypothetical protein [Streptomyces cyaneofuscatus]|uniref:hypothetical protein n=1 Tax=Streptomyces cyaneofuscatus TaxID=66883 RepID=UPI0037A4AC81
MTALFTEHPHLEVEPTLRELSIASSTHYRWRRAEKEPCERIGHEAKLTEKIRQVHADSGGSTARRAYTPPSEDVKSDLGRFVIARSWY